MSSKRLSTAENSAICIFLCRKNSPVKYRHRVALNLFSVKKVGDNQDKINSYNLIILKRNLLFGFARKSKSIANIS
jgi:hypothetical protein